MGHMPMGRMVRNGRGMMLMVLAGVMWLMLASGGSPAAAAMPQMMLVQQQSAAAPAAPAPTPADPERVRELMGLLADPTIQAWIAAQAAAGTAAPGSPPARTTMLPADAAERRMMAERLLTARVDGMRAFLATLSDGLPRVPAELVAAGSTFRDRIGARTGAVILPLLGFALLGCGFEWAFTRATRPLRQRIEAHPTDRPRMRLRVAGLRLLYGLGVLAAFALGSIGAFAVMPWPPMLRQVVASYLLIVLLLRLVTGLGRILLSPRVPRFRIVPMSDAAARHWMLWSAVLVGWYGLGDVTLDLLHGLGMAPGPWAALGLGIGLVLLLLTLIATWTRPEIDGEGRAHRSRPLATWLFSIYLVGVWMLLFTGSIQPFQVAIVLLVLFVVLLPATRRAVSHIVRPDDQPEGVVAEPVAAAPVHGGGEGGGVIVSAGPAPSMIAISVGRGLRAFWLLGAAVLIAGIIDYDLAELTRRETPLQRVMGGIFQAVMIVLLADIAWRLAAAWIDHRLMRAAHDGATGGEDALRRQARLRTLLPILRNLLLAVLGVITILMVLSSLGVEIGPLIAGAGVVGVAIGFGAQTLVKDIISGMFFLFDDAFRVGEYIESGSIRGTVESFSLRSMKLRHHRGALHTIPFGSLDKITNYSRDWVIDKLTVKVTYAADLDKVKKIIKQVGRDLQQDPEFAPNIIETLKMQGVEQFGDYAIQLRLKMMTRPGEQFVIRRRAYALIKKAFEANDIAFAFPTVSVSGQGGDAAAAAQATLAASAAGEDGKAG
jgi:small-conductance mechanosensitive channel